MPARKLCSVKISAGFLVRISFSSEINVTKVLVFLVSFDSHSILDILFGTHGHSDGHPGPSKKLFPAFRLEYVVSCLGVPRSPLCDPESATGLIKWPCLPSRDSPRVGPGLRPGLGPGLGPRLGPIWRPGLGRGLGPALDPGLGPSLGPAWAWAWAQAWALGGAGWAFGWAGNG